MSRRALIAVYDKTGAADLGRKLVSLGFELVSSGKTASALSDTGVSVTPVEDVTGFPEMLNGRVKTLHPNIHAGILADHRSQDHVDQLAERGIEPFELVVVNLYPFRETVASGAEFDEVIENIDIGGPAMVRAAAKNFESVGVVVSPRRYQMVIDELELEGSLSRATRLGLAAEAFSHTAAYDLAVASWFAKQTATGGEPPDFAGLALEKVHGLRYGENPHQSAALYLEVDSAGVLGGSEILQGKEMSFNNWLDVDSAYRLTADLGAGSCVIVKHNNPCGAAVGASLTDSYKKAFGSDTVSAFGGVVAFNGEVDSTTAEAMAEVFTEVVVAPSYSPEALEALSAKRDLRVVCAPVPYGGGFEIREISGGGLVQDRDAVALDRAECRIVSTRQPSEPEWDDLLFAWKVAARVKSNAIVFASDMATVGIGAGQMSRVDAAWIAARKAGDRAKGSVMASDAFFPFPDAVEVAADAGVTAVIHPGGSVRDEEVLAVAEERGMSVVVTGIRHFRH